MSENISKDDFVIRAIKNLRKEPYRGIHSVYSGFNQAFRQEFGEEPIPTTTRMEKEGKITIRPVRGGVMLYLPGEAPESINVKKVLEKIKEG